MQTKAGLRTAIVVAAMMAGAAGAQPYSAPRTPSGAPDLEGTWTNLSLTRLERPPEATTLVVDGPAATALEATLQNKADNPTDDEVGGRDTEWWDTAKLARVNGQPRTSWIISTPDGKLPFTAEGEARRTAAREAQKVFPGPEAMRAYERCMMPSFGAIGPPILNPPYAANYRIVQTSDHVVILGELNTMVRIIRLNATRQPGARAWLGESVGHWEKETLVVETTGFQPGESTRLPPLFLSPNAVVTERFTRASAAEIHYAFSINDRKAFTQVWRGEIPFLATDAAVYEFACHEGNYAMRGMLAGARKDEAQAAASLEH